MKLEKPVSWFHIFLGIGMFLPMGITITVMPISFGNLPDPEPFNFMLYIFWPLAASIIPFCIYFALFTKPRFVNDEIVKEGES